MAKRKNPSGVGQQELNAVKTAALTALLADDELTGRLVLKGGSALEMIYGVSDRASIDLDFSMSGAFAADEIGPLRNRIEHLLERGFGEMDHRVMDVKLVPKPPHLTADLVGFWGGYKLSFKVFSRQVFEQYADPEERRRRAVPVGAGGRTTFEIDISSHEYVEPRDELEVDGYTVFVYSPAMIVAEKLRAICQQMPEYASVVKRTTRAGAPRARDFFDIRRLVEHFNVDMAMAGNLDLLGRMFAAKRVPLGLLGGVKDTADFHRLDWPSVENTVRPGRKLDPFDDYFAFVVDLIEALPPDAKR